MAKRSGRRASRAARGAQNAAEQQPEGPVRRWWNGVTKAILGAGALASAVAAIVSLWPDPDAADVAKFAAVRVTPEVPFSEYRQRLVTAHASGDDSVGGRPWGASAYRPVVHRTDQPAPATEAPDENVTEAPSDDATVPPSTQPSPPDDTPPTSGPPVAPRQESASGAPAVEVTPAGPRQPHQGIAAEACQGLDMRASDCGESMKALAGAGNAPAPRAEAVQHLVNLVKQARTAEADQSEPLGVVVTVDVELTGLRNEPVLLSWSMWQKGGAHRLHGDWLNTNLAYRLTATSNQDTASLDFWIPLPPKPGPYFIRSILTSDGSTIASVDSETFH
jgi:hypothetical protein